jgi:hypothetical protein
MKKASKIFIRIIAVLYAIILSSQSDWLLTFCQLWWRVTRYHLRRLFAYSASVYSVTWNNVPCDLGQCNLWPEECTFCR